MKIATSTESGFGVGIDWLFWQIVIIPGCADDAVVNAAAVVVAVEVVVGDAVVVLGTILLQAVMLTVVLLLLLQARAMLHMNDVKAL